MESYLAASGADQDLRQLRRRLTGAALFLVVVLVVGVVGYRIIDPDTTFVDALYMTVITLTTVGFGEVVSLEGHPGGRLFTAALILVGMGGVLYFVSTATAFVLEGQLSHVFWRRRMARAIERLSDHLIVCGSGATATYTAAELDSVDRPIVVVCEDPDGVEFLQRELPDTPILMGDATNDEILQEAGIDRASGLVACTPSDKDNILIVLTARQLNPGLRIVARVGDIQSEQKARQAGADAVVSPNFIGGLRLASELLRPTVVTFLDQMLRDGEANLRIDEVRVPADSPAVGKRLGELALEDEGGALLVALRKDGGAWLYNPSADTEVGPDAVLVMMGSPADMREVCDRVGGEMVSKPVRRGG